MFGQIHDEKALKATIETLSSLIPDGLMDSNPDLLTRIKVHVGMVVNVVKLDDDRVEKLGEGKSISEGIAAVREYLRSETYHRHINTLLRILNVLKSLVDTLMDIIISAYNISDELLVTAYMIQKGIQEGIRVQKVNLNMLFENSEL